MKPVFVLVMGVSGSGKSTLATALAKEFGMPFYDADDLHPKSNVEKMSRGEPLSDADREPWLELVRTTAEHACVEQQVHGEGSLRGVIMACSALKKYYRDILRGSYKPDAIPPHFESPHPHTLPTYIVFISGSRETLLERMNTRKDHFMKATMLDSQIQTLESPEGEEGVIVVRLEESTEEQVQSVKERLHSLTPKYSA